MEDATDAAEEGHVVLSFDDDEQLDGGLEPGGDACRGRAEKPAA